jgi:hypothetical protein
MIIGFFAASVDILYWSIYGQRDMRIPPKDWWLNSLYAGLGGAAGAYALTYAYSTTDLLTSVVGGFIGGRLVTGIMETFKFDPKIATPLDPIPL